MLDEKNVYYINYKNEKGENKKIKLTGKYKSFKKLQKLTGDAFGTFNKFCVDIEERFELLPILIVAMAEEDLTVDFVEENVLTMSFIQINQIAELIIKILDIEMSNEVNVEEVIEVEEENNEKN